MHSINLSSRTKNVPILGAVAPQATQRAIEVKKVALFPDDFTGLAPRAVVKAGERVLAGQAVLCDKVDEALCVTAPVSGTVREVVRGERRKILRVEIDADRINEYKQFDNAHIATRQQAIDLLASAGMLARMRRRPYDIIPSTTDKVRDIFVTAFDTAPLADSRAGYVGTASDLAAAVRLLRMVTDGAVYITQPEGGTLNVPGAEMVEVRGEHPAGNVGPQIAAIAPINKGETVWTMSIDTLYKIGVLVNTGRVEGATTVAVTGPEVKEPALVRTVEGAEIAPLVAGNLKSEHVRVISGNILTGVAADDYLHYPWRQLTVIAEGDTIDEFMGWARPHGADYAADTRLRGGRRAMIMSGQYDKYMPMDILPEYLLKAIIGRDIERMEALGIYEVAPEDFALAEYYDPSKQPLQQTVRQGLDWLRKELQ